ncbi:NAD(P)/FAD-dependent oxidoreductase [Roseibium litorale]|uniref:FAD-dependent oxidoreductase n=1 Tax=Roseibium litorale TaxID=2803841 RepID=A0ABR9CJ52_9HYPH|nr:FAD-dependent oxidoreductase [Roseibium litorale]MBD8890664.1 FAD-dependent oxidoreductase [Roseibium litorale]
MKIIIVGAGIAGLSTACALTRRGAEVTLLEQGQIPNPLSASGDQHRIIRRAYGAQGGYQRRIGEAYAAWDRLWDGLGARHLADTGFLLLCRQPGDEAEGMRDGLIAGGYAFEDFSAAETAQRYPFLDGESLRYGTYSPEGGVLFCQKIAAGLRDWLAARGVDVRTDTRVASLDAEAGRVHLESGEDLLADKVVVTAGAWALGLMPSLSQSLTTYRTAVAYLTPPSDLQAHWETAPVILSTGGPVEGYVIPPVAGTGLKVGAGLHKRLGQPDQNRVPEPWEGLSLRNLMAPPFSRIEEYKVADVVTCAYTFTADEHFFVEETGKAVVVSACSGHGYKFGAVVGEKIAEGLLEGTMDVQRVWLEARD